MEVDNQPTLYAGGKMSPQSESAPQPSDPESTGVPTPLRSPEIGPALKRDRLLQRVRAARKRLSPAPKTLQIR